MASRVFMFLSALLSSTAASAADIQRVSESTVYLTVTGTIADEASENFGAVCTNTGTGFIISNNGVVVTARHLIDDTQCELVGDQPGQSGGVYRGRHELLQITRIEAYRGYSPEGQRPISAVVVAVDPDVDEEQRGVRPALDAALLDLNETRLLGYPSLDPCLSFLKTGDEFQMYGYRGGGVLIPVRAQAGQDLPEVDRFSLQGGEAGPGMSGGPVISTGDRPIGLVVSGQEGERLVTYAVPMRYLSRFVIERTGREVPNCERRPSDLERVGLRLDRALLYSAEQAAANPGGANAMTGDAVALFERNRIHYARLFLRNETALAEILDQSTVRADSFYDSSAAFFSALDGKARLSPADRVRAIRAYSANAFIIAKVDVGLDTLRGGLALDPSSTALALDLVNRYSSYERPRDVIEVIARRPAWLTTVQRDGTPDDNDFYLLSLYARALWQRNEGEDAARSYEIYEQMLARVDVGTPAGLERRLNLLNDRFPLVQNLMDRPEQAKGEMEEVLRGYRELFAATEDEAAAHQRYDGPIATAQNNLANSYMTLGRVAEARDLAEASVRGRERSPVVSPLGLATSVTNLGIAEIRLGDVDAGLERLLTVDRFFRSFADLGERYQLRVARQQREIGLAYLRQGDRDEAQRRLNRGLRELIALNELRDDHYPRTLFALGYYHLEGGELTEAVNRFREANAAIRPSDDQLRILLDVMLGEALVRREPASEEGVILLRRGQAALAALPPSAEYVVHFSRRELRDRVNRSLLAQ